MKLQEIIEQDKFDRFKIDDDFEENYCFVQRNSENGIFIDDNAVLMWSGYFFTFKDYLFGKKESGVIKAYDEATFETLENGFSKDIGFITDLEQEIEYLKQGKEDIKKYIPFKDNEGLHEILRLQLINLFESALKKGNQIALFSDLFVKSIDEDIENGYI